MKILRTVTLLLVLACALSSIARAGDFATLNFIGFSVDGRYLAYEEYGTQDGSGFPYSNIYVVDVVKNAFASTPVRIRIEKETASESLARSRAKFGSTSAFRKFGIVSGNTGKLVVSRMLTDFSAHHFQSEKPGGDQTINFAAVVGSMYRSGDYDLKLRSVAVRSKDCAFEEDYRDIFMLDLSLNDRERDKMIVLQKDASLPASRSCPINYAIQYVYLHGDHIAVFLNTYHQGFEGPDMRYMVVTGKIK